MVFQNFAVVVLESSFYVFSGGVTELDIVFVNDGPELVVRWEVLLY